MITTRTSLVALALLCLLAVTLSDSAGAFQSRDHLTPQEVELVKEAQVLDQRIEIFVKAADRRLLVLTGVDAPTPKQIKKNFEKWGELPNGSRAELLGDIAKILDEAITNIDDVSARDEKNPLIPKALRKLAAEATRIFDQLRPMREQAKGDAEIARFEELTENAESILEAAKKLPPPVEKQKSRDDKAKGKN
jgi:acyl-CoA reductase-like NAD-dependent aldehyde dehydrogenase